MAFMKSVRQRVMVRLTLILHPSPVLRDIYAKRRKFEMSRKRQLMRAQQVGDIADPQGHYRCRYTPTTFLGVPPKPLAAAELSQFIAPGTRWCPSDFKALGPPGFFYVDTLGICGRKIIVMHHTRIKSLCNLLRWCPVFRVPAFKCESDERTV